MAACVGDMKARMALCCIACRKCRDNVYRRSITLSLPFFLLLLTDDWKHIVPFVQAVMCLLLLAFCWIYWTRFGQSLFRIHLSSTHVGIVSSSSQAALFCLVVNIWRPRLLLYTQLGLFWFEFSMWHWQETRQGFDVDVYVRLWK